MDAIELNEALKTLGAYLLDKGLKYEVVAIGGGALLLLGCIIRPTKDLDIVALKDRGELISAHPLPVPLMEAIKEVGLALKLREDWINWSACRFMENGPARGISGTFRPSLFWRAHALLCEQVRSDLL